jgi:hypothetical protein
MKARESMNRSLICFIAVLMLLTTAQAAASSSLSKPAPAKGPLRVHPKNPHYFTDGDLNGSGQGPEIHTLEAPQGFWGSKKRMCAGSST